MDYLRSPASQNGSAAPLSQADLATSRASSAESIRTRTPGVQASAAATLQRDRVTVSPMARGLANQAEVGGPASLERLEALRHSVQNNTLPIFPQRIAEAILADEGDLPNVPRAPDVTLGNLGR